MGFPLNRLEGVMFDGRCDQESDALAAAMLDRNAARLKEFSVQMKIVQSALEIVELALSAYGHPENWERNTFIKMSPGEEGWELAQSALEYLKKVKAIDFGETEDDGLTIWKLMRMTGGGQGPVSMVVVAETEIEARDFAREHAKAYFTPGHRNVNEAIQVWVDSEFSTCERIRGMGTAGVVAASPK